jgi:hypothetical protein
MPHDLLLVDIRDSVGLSGVYGCEWFLKQQHLNLLLKGGDHCCPLLDLEVLLLVGVLKEYDRMFHPCSASLRWWYTTFKLWSWSEGGSVPLWRSAFSCFSCSSSREMAVLCSSYAVKRIRCCMTVLAVLCCKLNKYWVYLTIAAMSAFK